jgi:thiol-disulfide isomerase/thioredoxin
MMRKDDFRRKKVAGMKKNIWVLAAVVILVAAALYQNFVQADEVSLPKEEAPKAKFLAPSFSLTGMDGNTYHVGGPRDKALLINFWASWCGPCKLEAPDLTEIYEEYKDRLDIYAVNATNDDDKKNAEAFVAEYGFEFPVLWDLPKGEGSVVDLYRIGGYPTSFIVDKNGVIQEVILGIRSKEDMERMIRKVL